MSNQNNWGGFNMMGMMGPMMGMMGGRTSSTSGNEGGFNMMGMMEMMGPMMGMMSGRTSSNSGNGGGFDMWEMCRQMMSFMTPDNFWSSFTRPGINNLFMDWLEKIEKEIIDFTKDTNSMDPEKVAAHFNLSKESAEYLIWMLGQKKKYS